MLRNIIFDMGNVLIEYDPARFIRRAGIEDPLHSALLLRELFHSPDWAKLDSGEWTERDLLERVYCRLPEFLHGIARYLALHWDEPLIPVPGMKELIAECKGAGMGIYLLSNASFRQSEYWPRVPGSEYFDGTMVSACQGCVKPMPEIYACLLRRFHLQPQECLFVDDVMENVQGAQRAGMRGFQFTGDVDALRRAVKSMLAE